MEATKNFTKAIGATQEAGLQANSVIDAMYKGCARYLVMPRVRHTRLGLHIAVNLKGRTTRIWSFGCGFTCATAMGCTGFRL